MIIYLRQTFILFVCVTCRYGVKTFDTKVKRELLCEAAMCTFCECSHVSERAKRTPEGKGGGDSTKINGANLQCYPAG